MKNTHLVVYLILILLILSNYCIIHIINKYMFSTIIYFNYYILRDENKYYI